MALTLLDLSQTNFGLILAGKKSVNEYLASYFESPYTQAIQYMKDNPDWTLEELATDGLPPSAIRAAKFAAEASEDLEEMDWVTMLKEKATVSALSPIFKRAAKMIDRGKDPNLLQVMGQVKAVSEESETGLALASEVDTSNYVPFVRCGYRPLDDILGGVPADGPTIIYGPTGVGKSQFIAQFSIGFLKEHPTWTGALFTLEMGVKHWKWRTERSYPELEDVEDRLYISSDARDIDELEAKVASLDVDFVVIDDMDGIVTEVSAVGHEDVYMKVKRICRLLGIPVFVIAQAKPAALAANRFLTAHDVNWSGAGFKVAALMIALQIVDEFDIDGDDGYQTYDEPHAYLIVTKSRDGYPKMQGPGAIILEHDPNSFWTGNYVAKKFFKKGKRVPLKR